MTTASSASEGPGTGPVRRARATRRQAVLGTLLVGGAALASVAPTWVVAGTRSALDDAVPIAVRGADAAPATAAGALVVVAGALALALAGRWGVRVASVGVGLGGVLVTAAALAVARAPEGPARAAALDTVGVATLTDPAGTTPLPWVAAALGLVA
ncbi:Trp biosynthesis-associated membrane protein, partial [Actinotalea sp. AC32]|nr:Trp biosynthesis-associated membrane protein [Actinotalea sp. AC32]